MIRILFRAIERRQMLFIRVFTMVFLASLFFGARGASARYVATVPAVAWQGACETVPATSAEPDGDPNQYLGPGVAESTVTLLNSPQFAKRVTAYPHRTVSTSDYHTRVHRAEPIVLITSEASSPLLAAATVEGVADELERRRRESESLALAQTREYLVRLINDTQERMRGVPPGDPEAAVAQRERDDYVEKLKLVEARIRPRFYCAQRLETTVEARFPATRSMLLPGLLALTLAVLSVLVGDLTLRRRP